VSEKALGYPFSLLHLAWHFDLKKTKKRCARYAKKSFWAWRFDLKGTKGTLCSIREKVILNLAFWFEKTKKRCARYAKKSF